ncbi:IclR family transcriptional regulator [Kitasatospora phosalacinea]|uniref:IclR family transcriptional regulator n=1 Tax=Kitasatospora phosalacinea TaxID=2065 RepID=UPI000524FACC|nr:IclR family transcriptional regulator [Kitasatospora phosalacinea]
MEGAQAISRAATLLRVVSAAADGVTTAQAAQRAGTARTTAHRILSSLQEAGLLDRDRATGTWHPGPEMFLMGTLAARRYDFVETARPAVRALADETGESAFLSLRRGDESVCVLREEGSFPLRSFVLQEGTRFPLGVASGGLALLSFLPDQEAEDYLARADLVPQWGEAHSAERVRERVRLTRTAGYATNPALVLEGSWGMAATVFDQHGRPAWAVSITGVETRFRPERRPQMGQLLLRTAHRLSTRNRLPQHGGGRPVPGTG